VQDKYLPTFHTLSVGSFESTTAAITITMPHIGDRTAIHTSSVNCSVSSNPVNSKRTNGKDDDKNNDKARRIRINSLPVVRFATVVAELVAIFTDGQEKVIYLAFAC